MRQRLRMLFSRIDNKWSVYSGDGKRKLRGGIDTPEEASRVMSEIARARKKGA